ncbi:MAG: hypothetical protein WC474_05225 [Hydrogenophilaceae bacterium]
MLAGCAGDPIQRKNGKQTSRPFVINNLAKSDIDMVTEQTQRQVLAGLRRLTVKLYRRNPQEYRKAGYGNVETATAQIFNQLPRWRQSGLDRVDWAESLRLAFNENYAGDRVHAYMLALIVMTMASYDHRVEFYMTDDLNAQGLYNSARNLETAAWKLANARTAGGAPFLLSNGVEDEIQNLSFEREFGKLIAQQDLLALVIEDKSNRSINRVFQNVASFVLLPV